MCFHRKRRAGRNRKFIAFYANSYEFLHLKSNAPSGELYQCTQIGIRSERTDKLQLDCNLFDVRWSLCKLKISTHLTKFQFQKSSVLHYLKNLIDFSKLFPRIPDILFFLVRFLFTLYSSRIFNYTANYLHGFSKILILG